MKKSRICVINLPRERNYAIVSPHRIVYGLNASENELDNLIKEEEERTVEIDKSKSNCDRMHSQFANIGLIPTFDCNLNCIYCYSKGGEVKKTMNLEMAKSAVEATINTCNDRCNQLDIYLVGGGEPLLPFELICDVVAFAKSIYETVNVHVVTNGSFGTNVLEWLIKNKVDIRISYDGLMHNTQRPFAIQNGLDSKEIVRENIKALIAKNIPVTVQCIVTNKGLYSLRQTTDEAIEMGVKVLKFEPVLITDVSRGTKEMEPNPVKYAKALLDVIEYVVKLGVDLQIDTGYFAEPSDKDYCGITNNNKIVTPDGLITACVEVARETDPYADPIIFGKLKGKHILVDEKRLKILGFLHYKNQAECAKCNLRFICQGGCPMANIWRSGFPFKKSSFTCKVERKLIPTLLLKIAENPRVAEVVFNNNASIKIY